MSSLRKERADRLAYEAARNGVDVRGPQRGVCPHCRGMGQVYATIWEPCAPCGGTGGINLPGVETTSLGSILQKEAERPLRGGSADLAHDSMFGDGHKQKELF